MIELDGTIRKTIEGDELKNLLENAEGIKFTINGSDAAHKLVVYAVDKSGNGEMISGGPVPENAVTISDFYVTTNLWIRYYNNKLLFFGSIGGVVLIAAAIVALVVLKRRKNESR